MRKISLSLKKFIKFSKRGMFFEFKNKARRDIKFWHKIALVIFGILFTFFMLEIALRLAGLWFLFSQSNVNNVYLNKKDSITIMCLGESTTAMGGKSSYPRQLEELLNQQNSGLKFRVINKGIPGSNSSEIVLALEGNIKRYSPDIVVVMMGINDSGNNLFYSTSRSTNPIRSLRIYKLFKIIWGNIEQKMKLSDPTKGLKIQEKHDNFINSKLKDIWLKQEVLTDSEEFFKNNIKVNPKNDIAYIELALFYGLEGDYLRAEGCLKYALEKLPLSNEKKYTISDSLGTLYEWQGKWIQARKSFENSLKYVQRKGAHYDVAFCFMREGNFVKAREILQKALENNPQDERASRFLLMLSLENLREGLRENLVNNNHDLEIKSTVVDNYLILKRTLDRYGIKLVCVQYPMRCIGPLKKIFNSEDNIIFVDNSNIFMDVVRKSGFGEYFIDAFAGDFGHCSPKGNRLLAKNISDSILKEIFKIDLSQ
jgi:tetratricopeptide (TPR) repeat protein